MKIIEGTLSEFKETTKDGVTLVDFYAPWCMPCKVLAKEIDKLEELLGDSERVVKVNVDDESDLAGEFGVMGIPAMFLMKDGEIVERLEEKFLPAEQLVEKMKEV